MASSRLLCSLSATSLLLVAGFLCFGAVGCQKDEAPPPLPSSEGTPDEPPPTELKLADEPDAGDEDEKKPTGKWTGAPKKGLQSCCNALAGNAKSAPEPQASQLKIAAGICSSVAASGGSLAQLKGRLPAGIAIPGACL